HLSTASPTPQLATLSLHDALPILMLTRRPFMQRPIDLGAETAARVAPPSEVQLTTGPLAIVGGCGHVGLPLGLSFARKGYQVDLDRKSTRLNSSHGSTSYAVFCLK